MRFPIRKILGLLLTPSVPLMGPRLRRWATRTVNPRGKLYIPAKLGVSGFFQALLAAGAQHVVLRWFEELPHVERGHDLDILVADEAIDTVRALLSDWPRGQRIDFYSVTGRKDTGYHPSKVKDVPAFPPAIAERMLESARPRPGGWSVPGPREHFLGLAYHAVYLKGYLSGLPPDETTPPHHVGSRDYAAVLTELGAEVGIPVAHPVTMASLDAMLRAEGWRPDEAHLAALAPVNPWIGQAT